MCEHDATATPLKPSGSRRTRLWELSHPCHCPLVGVCLPLDTLRRVLGKVLAGELVADDYELHVGVVAQCTQRNLVSDALQRELDRRFALTLRQFAKAKTSEAVHALWHQAMHAGDVAGALWAALTHPRCDHELRETLCRDIHMVQHQAGAMQRADLTRLATLTQQQQQLSRELLAAQQRDAQQQAERAAEQERHGAQLMQLRAEAIRKDTLVATLRSELTELRQAMPELQSRKHLSQRVAELGTRNRALELELAELKRQWAQHEQEQLHAQEQAASAEPITPEEVAPVQLAERSVLCVGGRLGSIPVYRELVERHGGRFAHHDGGLEDNPHRLDASLAAADLVICQTGCLSHNAYWRVKDHCKRTGKRCVYLDKPSVAGFVRGLAQMPEAEATTPTEAP